MYTKKSVFEMFATEQLCFGGEFIQFCQEILSKENRDFNPQKEKWYKIV